MIYFKYIVWGGILMLCVIAKIDPKSKARFLKLQEKIEKLGISVKALHGHITLVSYMSRVEQVQVLWEIWEAMPWIWYDL